MIRKILSSRYKKFIAGSFNFKCQNKPGYPYFLLKGNNSINNDVQRIMPFEDYHCTLYKNGDGSFNNKNFYEIDHYIDLRFGGLDKSCNYFPLCHICHKIKTERGTLFQSLLSKNFFCKYNIYDGCLFMQTACRKDCNCNIN